MSIIIRRKGKWAFLRTVGMNPKILDVGYGNESPMKTKIQLPNSYYCGVDITSPDEKSVNFLDRYVLCKPENFHECIESLDEEFDAVISSHNLEHCQNRWSTLESMANRVKLGGSIFLSFPTEISASFPSRKNGCLNYYDNDEHIHPPPEFSRVIESLEQNGFKITYYSRMYRPLIPWIIGLFVDRFHRLSDRVGIFTWEYYGFETIIWAKKIQNS